MTITVDLEPTWVEVLRMVEAGAVDLSELMEPCKIMDVIRQAQKHGIKSLTFTFLEDGRMEYDDGKKFCANCATDEFSDAMGNCPTCGVYMDEEE